MAVLQTQFDGRSLITPSAIALELEQPKGRDFETQLATGKGEIALILELARQQFEKSAEPKSIIDSVTTRLHEARAQMHPRVWQDIVPLVQNHPVASYFLQDPLTRWSFDKPRGYSGDARLLDFIYRHASTTDDVDNATDLGRALYEYTSTAPSSLANWDRRDILARYVDEAAAATNGAEILSVAAGHLREASHSQALAAKAIKRWVGLDQDPLSVGTIARDFQNTAVEAIDGSVRSILTGRQHLGQFDLVYASGLYDYLTNKVAVKLTQRCLDMVKPGGVFLFANYAYPILVDGYLETFMNWSLLLRSEADMWNIINASTTDQEVRAEVFFGKNRNIIYGVLRKLS